MWTKDTYQEQMLSYLDAVAAEISQIAYARPRQHDINVLYAALDATVERLWLLIGASDVDWEWLRSPVEIGCDRLQRVLYRTSRTDVPNVSASRTVGVKRSRKTEQWKSVELPG